ncbi:MAG: hypothetical protein K940chlam3_00373 [Chlamydiae bacterium]|nr:hypothetical protein [Chlamydiota bacterium]
MEPSRPDYERFYELEFKYMIPADGDVKVIDYNLCEDEFCFLLDFSKDIKLSRNLKTKTITIEVPEKHARNIAYVSTFLLQKSEGGSHGLEGVTGVRYLSRLEDFKLECQKCADNRDYTKNIRVPTSFEELSNGEFVNR